MGALPKGLAVPSTWSVIDGNTPPCSVWDGTYSDADRVRWEKNLGRPVRHAPPLLVRLVRTDAVSAVMPLRKERLGRSRDQCSSSTCGRCFPSCISNSMDDDTEYSRGRASGYPPRLH